MPEKYSKFKDLKQLQISASQEEFGCLHQQSVNISESKTLILLVCAKAPIYRISNFQFEKGLLPDLTQTTRSRSCFVAMR